MKINYLDLFSGVGGFTRGLLDAGFTFGWHGFSEIDKHAVKLYQGLYPDAEAMGDIKQINDTRLSALRDRGINLITFGFPCQDLSIAGNRKGLAGKRSGLFYEALRIIQTIRPDCFIFENVKGLFSSKGGADFKAVLQAVADLGFYDCQWQLLNTKWFLPQNRERIYFVGLLRGQQLFGREIFPVGETGEIYNKQEQSRKAIQQPAQCLKAGDYAKWNGNFVAYQKTHSKCITQHTNEIGTLQSARLDKVPAIAVGTLRTHKDGEGFRAMKDEISPCLNGRARQDGSQQTVIAVSDVTRITKDQNGRRIKDVGDPMFTIDNSTHHGVMAYDLKTPSSSTRIRRLTPLECFRLQFGMRNAAIMIDKARELKISDTQLYKMAGNAVSSPVVEMIGRKLLQAVE